LLVVDWWPPLISLVLIGLCFAMVPAALWPCLPLLVEERHLGTSFGLLSGFTNAGLTLFYWLQGQFPSEGGESEAFLFGGLVGVGFVLTCVWLVIDAKMGHLCNSLNPVQLTHKDVAEK